MKIPERGMVYKTSFRAYLGNYLIGAGVVVFALILWFRVGLTSSFEFSNLEQIPPVILYIGLDAAVIWLFGEPFFERSMRYYVVSNSEVVKVEGILWKNRATIPYQSVSGVKVRKGIFGRILSYGTVDIIAFGENHISMKYMSNPDEIERILQQKINASARVDSRERQGTRRARGVEKKDKQENSLE